MRTSARAIVVKDNNLLVMHRNKFGQKYYALIGGGVDFGESTEQALYREVMEETGIEITNHKLVIIEHAGDMYGDQYIYSCEYVRGNPQLAADSQEALISAAGKNLYQPLWLPITDLGSVVFLPRELQTVLVGMLRDGYPDEPITLTIQD